MRIATVNPSKLFGELSIQPSKSVGHRLAICAALAGRGSVSAHPPSTVSDTGDSDDIRATTNALISLGYDIEVKGTTLYASGKTKQSTVRTVDCGESGSTLRFLFPLALDGVETRFVGGGRLLSRPMGVYEDICASRGIDFNCERERANGEITAIRTNGRLVPGVYELPGNVSSQFVSGLMFALFSLDGDSELVLTTPLESKGYVDLTIQALSEYGITVETTKTGYRVRGCQTPRRADTRAEGDWSHAAFFLVGGALSGDVSCLGLKQDSRQGDRAIVDVLRDMGADITVENGAVRARKSALFGRVIDASQIPDLVPVLAVAACAASGETRIVNAARLRLKESDRLSVMSAELNKLGAQTEETSDGLVIWGMGRLRGGRVSSHNDHRAAMSLAVAASVCDSPVVIEDSGAVKKSAPRFFDELRALGGDAMEVEQ